MSSYIDTTSQKIEAREIPDGEGLQMLPRHFGRDMLTVEYAIFAFIRKLAQRYAGGYWIYDLSNGGCYMAPRASRGYHIVIEGNGFSGIFDPECAGIVATLFALSHVLMDHRRFVKLADRFHQLRAFACEHPDGNLILAATD